MRSRAEQSLKQKGVQRFFPHDKAEIVGTAGSQEFKGQWVTISKQNKSHKQKQIYSTFQQIDFG